jgi:voltage-gated potassium channel
MTLRSRVGELLNPTHASDRLSRLINFFFAGLILANVAALVVESMPGMDSTFFHTFESVSVILFTIEYLARAWSWEPAHGGGTYAQNRVRFLLSPLAIIDLVVILPWYLPFVGMDLRVLRSLRLMRLLRIVRLGRYSRALRAVGQVVHRARSELAVTLTLGCVTLLIASTLMYYAEHDVQPEVFSSIPATSWWAVMTLTTVGYGDTYPITTLGRVVGAIVATLGIGLFALPTAILGSAYLEVLRNRDHTCPHCGRDANEALKNAP